MGPIDVCLSTCLTLDSNGFDLQPGSDCEARQDLTQHHQVVMGVEHYLQGREAPYGPTELRPMTILEKTTVLGDLLDQCVSDTCNFAGDGNTSLGFEIGRRYPEIE